MIRPAALIDDPQLAPLRRSLTYYYGGDDSRRLAAERFYRRFVRPGDLVFDIGSHVGDRVAVFRRLGARVVAVEPQPMCAQVLHRLYDADEGVSVLQAACGSTAGLLSLHVNTQNPTVSTLSSDFVSAARGARGWDDQVWDHEITVPTITLDMLVDRYGTPDFVKIDVEGFEDAVLAGLSHPVPALSFEFTTIARDVAVRCLDRVSALGSTGFDVSLGESMELAFGRWVDRPTMDAHLAGLPDEANAGDVYAVA